MKNLRAHNGRGNRFRLFSKKTEFCSGTMTRSCLLRFLGAAIVLFAAQVAAAAVIIVDASDNADFASVQDAVDSASEGDTIKVKSGTYREHVVISKDDISIIGIAPEDTIINSGGGISTIFLDGVSNTRVSSLTLRNDPATFFADVTYTGSPLEPAAYSPLPANYRLSLLDVDVDGQQAWLQLDKDSHVIDAKVVEIGQRLELRDDNDALILSAPWNRFSCLITT